MKTESSSENTEVDSLLRGFLTPSEDKESEKKEKFVSRRHIVFPSELFIELKLKKKDVLKVKQWESAGQTFLPMWFASLERVLFINEELFHEWSTRQKP